MKPELLAEACPVSVSKHWGIMKWAYCISHKTRARIQMWASIDTLTVTQICTRENTYIGASAVTCLHTHTHTLSHAHTTVMNSSPVTNTALSELCDHLLLSLLFPSNSNCTAAYQLFNYDLLPLNKKIVCIRAGFVCAETGWCWKAPHTCSTAVKKS